LTEAPSKKPVELGCVYDLQEKSFPKRKRLRSPDAAYSRGGNFWSPTIWRVSTTAYKRQPVLVSSPDQFPGNEPKIICTIKTIRNLNLKEIENMTSGQAV